MSEQPSANTHTPGPWEYWPAGNYNGFAIAPRGTLPTLASVERVGTLCNIQAHNFPGSTEANARLIAEAPTMYALLSRVADGHEITMSEAAEVVRRVRG